MTIFWVILVAVAGHGVVTLDFQGPLKEHFGMNLCVGALQINIAMFVFNLFVPAYPLDGGRVLANVLLHFGVEANKAAKITAMVFVHCSLGVLSSLDLVPAGKAQQGCGPPSVRSEASGAIHTEEPAGRY
eukprot:CAMPEP_0114573782 /NCGR_PEP_ID=MMETSP0114-20121206/19048_1 /TAXON_ID=31324 /ORGANISM="Goniomonas sp, Strain m" /LENGTH=129 /DNA_ID=CAMNT_0001761161 /DNA_START=287 /DNA_END=676 /DNA_ORIENTATION=-